MYEIINNTLINLPIFPYKINFEARNNYKKKIEEKKKELLEILKQVKGTCADTDKMICDYLYL